ncbi:hypothetical protein CERZMDRAFT_54506, partial [Cercospora zeae-maydis SCOH1-5]
FLDDIAIRRPKTKYSNEEVKPRLRRFVVEYIRNLDKLQLCYKQIKIVGYVTNKYSRYLDAERVAKLVK